MRSRWKERRNLTRIRVSETGTWAVTGVQPKTPAAASHDQKQRMTSIPPDRVPGSRGVFDLDEHSGDVKLRARGPTLENIFVNAAKGMMAFMFGDEILNARPERWEAIRIEAADREAALADALVNDRIGGAGIDVLPEEPPVNGNILLDLNLPNLIVTPHVAWASQTAMRKLADQLTANIQAFAAGKPQNVVV